MRMYEKAKMYKKLWKETQGELDAVREECEVYKCQAEEMKRIALVDVQMLR